MFIKLPDSRSIGKSVATRQQSKNYRAEAYALLAAPQTLNQAERLPNNTMFLTDCRSILQNLQSPEGEQIFSNIRQELSLLRNKTPVTLQWIPSHCGVGGNEEADRLSKMGSKLEQSAHSMSYSEAKVIVRNSFRTEWRQRLDIGTEEDSIHQLDRATQVKIFRLRTGHCQLLPHLYRLNFFHSGECPSVTGPQTPYHILQSCPTFDALRRRTWPSPVDAHRKFRGPAETLRQTADFALLTGLRPSMAGSAVEEEVILKVFITPPRRSCGVRRPPCEWEIRRSLYPFPCLFSLSSVMVSPLICPGVLSILSIICPDVLLVYQLSRCLLCSLCHLSRCPPTLLSFITCSGISSILCAICPAFTCSLCCLPDFPALFFIICPYVSSVLDIICPCLICHLYHLLFGACCV